MQDCKEIIKVLSIAGSDSGGGAGIQADIKTISALGGYACTAITAITAQNTLGVEAISIVDTNILLNQISCVIEDIKPKAIKIGMIADKNQILEVSKLLMAYKVENIVLDPVMVATSGSALSNRDSVKELIKSLLPICKIVTPNLKEAKILSGYTLDSEENIIKAGKKILEYGPYSVLIKGGHLEGDCMKDYLFYANNINTFSSKKIETKNLHGTGCTLSSAIAFFIAKGEDIPSSVKYAKAYIDKAILFGVNFNIGSGNGPINHFWD